MPEPRRDIEAPAELPEGRASSLNSTAIGEGTVTGDKGPRRDSVTEAQKLKNPLVGFTREDVLADADAFVTQKGLEEHRDVFRTGALLAQHMNTPSAWEQIDGISEEDRYRLRREETNRWDQPFQLYFLCILCAGSAIVQGMDQTAVNGAQEFYYKELDITNEWMQGLMNGAPYLCSALIGCWTNPILNKIGGRRFTIFFSCAMSVVTGFWMAVANNYANLLIARFFLGFAVGAKSSTTPVYSAESTPKNIRGALTMQWQMWTAFGICIGFVVSVAFAGVTIFGENTQWRWMLASTSIPPLVVMLQVYFCPESPRWYMEKGRYDKAFESTCRLRHTKLQAARDMYYAYKLLEIEREQREGRNLLKEFFTVRRNYRAAQSAWFVMFMQQFCGVNVIAYYSTSIFQRAGLGRTRALLASMGGGLINWIFAIPAIYTIDTFGRRNLLLVGFPIMSACLIFTAGGMSLEEGHTARIPIVMTGLYLFMGAYSPTEGPVPFTYSAEAFPLHIRDIGMSSSTAITWGFNFIISFTWPSINKAFTPTGGFLFYAAWNAVGAVWAYFMLPETKGLTLEELDSVFNVTNGTHAGYYTRKLPWYLNKHILRKDVEPFPPLYAFSEDTDVSHMANEKPAARHSEGGVLDDAPERRIL